MSVSVSTAVLIQWLEGELPASEADDLAAKVEQDSRLAARAEWLQSFLNHRRSAVLEDPPPDLRRELTSAFRNHHAIQTGELVFDSRSDGVLVRSSSAEGPWSTVHTSLELDVALDLLPSDGDAETVIDVSGQIMLGGGAGHEAGSGVAGSTIDWRRASAHGQAKCDHLGHFHLGEMEPGRYVVTVNTESSTMAIDVDLGDPSGA